MEATQEKKDLPSLSLDDIFERLQKCESIIFSKENEIAEIKITLDRERKINAEQSEQLITEIKRLKKSNEETRDRFEEEIRILKNENELIERKLDTLETRVNESRNIEDVSCGNYQEIEPDYLTPVFKPNRNVELKQSESRDLASLKERVQEIESGMRDIRRKLGQKAENIAIQDLAVRTNNVEQITYERRHLHKHIQNIENILFAWGPSLASDKSIKINWVFHNYAHHCHIGKDVDSPVFYPEINGYSFRLRIGWLGENKENLGLALWLCRGRDYNGELKAFRMMYTLEIFDKNGKCRKNVVTPSEIEKHRDTCFTILPDEDVVRFGRGRRNMLTMPSLSNYVINDMLFISCTLQPY